MAYSVSNIIPLNLILTPTGLGVADFSSAFAFADSTDGVLDEYFAVDTYRDYSSITEVGEDFDTTSEVYKIASRWFANIPRPSQISIWMWDSVADSAVEVATKADNETWRFWYFFDHDTVNNIPTALELGTFADATEHYIPMLTTAPEAIDPQDDTDLISEMQSAGNRFVSVGYKDPASVSNNPSQVYSMVQLAAAFNKFNPDGFRTAITGEFQVLPGVSGDSLTTTAYNALKEKKGVFFTQVELQGETDNSRVINSYSMSSFGEFMDDVVNLAVLKNRLQVNGYNAIANAGTKRSLNPEGYSTLLDSFDKTCKQFYNNGVAGRSTYVDEEDGETKVAKFGYVIRGNPSDALNLSDSNIADREFPATSILVILARAGHKATLDVTVE